MKARHPRALHWYLMKVGTEPSRQGRSLGAAVIRVGLARCDRDGLPAYLEAASLDLMPFYRSLGFHESEPIHVEQRLSFYPMWRDPVSR